MIVRTGRIKEEMPSSNRMSTPLMNDPAAAEPPRRDPGHGLARPTAVESRVVTSEDNLETVTASRLPTNAVRTRGRRPERGAASLRSLRLAPLTTLPSRREAGPNEPLLVKEALVADGERGRERLGVLRHAVEVTDLVVASAAGVAGATLAGLTGNRVLLFAAAVAVVWAVAVFTTGLYRFDTLRTWATGMADWGRLAGMALAVSWPLAGLAMVEDAERPLTGALAATGLLLGGSILGRAMVRATLHRIAPLRQRCIVVGSGLVADQMVQRFRRHGEYGLDVIGVVDDDPHADIDLQLPVMGPLQDLREIVRKNRVERVIIAFTRASHQELLQAMRVCREERVAVDVVPRLFEFLEGARSLEQIGGLPVMPIGVPRITRSGRWAKRALDVVVSAFALLVLSPVFLATAIAIKLDSPGPVFFRQPRAGRNNTVFHLRKFRSMYCGADALKAQLGDVNEMDDGVMFKMRQDPRITRTGGFLRRLSIDELPQLLNVLRGEMSLVGPRPLVLPEMEALNEAWHVRRLDLRPGITGPWQVSGRSDLSAHDMVRLDFQYVTGWSLIRDCEILLATVPAVLKGRGAY